ncbi:MAG TPA: hypothetical protein VM529_27245, partial [Gemmata sp.]|nr:hypothetical protein [Gemmata sp.]
MIGCIGVPGSVVCGAFGSRSGTLGREHRLDGLAATMLAAGRTPAAGKPTDHVHPPLAGFPHFAP